VRPVRVMKRPKKTKEILCYSGNLGIRPDHPRHPIEIPFGMVGGLLAVVISFKFRQHQLSGYRVVNGRYLAHLITLAKEWLTQQPYSPYARAVSQCAEMLRTHAVHGVAGRGGRSGGPDPLPELPKASCVNRVNLIRIFWEEVEYFQTSIFAYSVYRVQLKKHPPQKSHYFQSSLLFFGEIFRGYSRDFLPLVLQS